MKKLSYNEMSNELIKEFAVLKPEYNEMLKLYEDEIPGPHIVYGDILNPYLISLLENADQNQYELQRIFDFLEFLANHEDLHIQEVVQMTVLEYIGGKKEVVPNAKKFMGPKTKILFDEIQKFWGE